MPHPLPWYIAGPLIGLIVPALLLAGNKAFGISSNFRHICGAVAPCGLEFFQHDWKRTGLWNLIFLAGACTGAAIAAWLAPPTVQISARTIEALRAIGVREFTGLAPHDLFGRVPEQWEKDHEGEQHADQHEATAKRVALFAVCLLH